MIIATFLAEQIHPTDLNKAIIIVINEIHLINVCIGSACLLAYPKEFSSAKRFEILVFSPRF